MPMTEQPRVTPTPAPRLRLGDDVRRVESFTGVETSSVLPRLHSGLQRTWGNLFNVGNLAVAFVVISGCIASGLAVIAIKRYLNS